MSTDLPTTRRRSHNLTEPLDLSLRGTGAKVLAEVDNGNKGTTPGETWLDSQEKHTQASRIAPKTGSHIPATEPLRPPQSRTFEEENKKRKASMDS
ncbi:hypothetical protein Slin14017_G116310 [Septoria linicola]|nr:hypothetical protein Slin14017_G116310 [Septoria linicola]